LVEEEAAFELGRVQQCTFFLPLLRIEKEDITSLVLKKRRV